MRTRRARNGAQQPKGGNVLLDTEGNFHMFIHPSILPCKALQSLFEVLLCFSRPFGPSDSPLLGLLRIPETLTGSLKQFDAL